jgi:ABC-type transport system substrate-binding protein
VILGIHLLYGYLYDWAESEAIKWWTVSEAVIWSFPLFNPLVPSSDHNAYINGLLYRSMMEYSTISETLETDLVSCNTENLLYIQCTLENNLTWSDGSDITTEDIKATLSVIAETKVNPIIASLLEGTTIETGKNTISFSNISKDINFLQIFLQPILPASVIERLDTNNIEWKFSEINGIYSGRFVLTSISQDETVGITKITLWKNDDYFGNDMYINFLILNLFRDETHFLKNKNSFNVYNDKNSIIWSSIPRLSSHQYTLSQFVASFLNTQTLHLDFRSHISWLIDRDSIVASLWESYVSPAYNPFLSDTLMDLWKSDFNMSEYLKKEWYYSKKDLLKNTLALQEEANKQKKLISDEALPKEQEQEEEVIAQETLNYITSPYSDKYNFVTQDNILIKWKVDSWVEAVYINDYQLSGFNWGDNIFFYRLSESYDSITQGENTYKLYFETDGKKQFMEEFTYVYHSDKIKLSEIKDGYFWSVKKTPVQVNSETGESEETQTDTFDISLNSAQIQELDNNFYYNSNGERFSLKLVYVNTDALMWKAIESIRNLLQDDWIALEVQALDLWEITLWLRNEDLQYDIIVLGINLWYFESNIFPYFHSSQIQNGYNLANYKKLSLDILLEELKSNNLSVTKREELELKMLDIIWKESIIKVLYTPKIRLLVDKNIKNFSLPDFLPDSRHRYYPLLQSYLSEKRIINSDEKWFFDFIKYLFTAAFR